MNEKPLIYCNTKFLILMLLFLLLLTGCNSKQPENNYLKEINVDDFQFTISIDNCIYKIGDEINIKAELKNISGQTMKIEVGHVDYKTIEDCIVITYSINDNNPVFFMNDLGGKRNKIIFDKNTKIIKERKILLEHKKYTIQACVYFYVGEEFNEKIFKLSNQIIVEIDE